MSSATAETLAPEDAERRPGRPRTGAARAAARPAPAVEVVVPVYNEQRVLAANVRELHRHLAEHFAFAFQITIADNASTDATPWVARQLAHELAEVEVLRLERKGRGHALRAAWSTSEADVLAYMDVDLSTHLDALGELLAPLLSERCDIAIGSRLAPGARVTRGFKRELISRSYNLLLRALLGAGFSDAQCGFKAGRREVLQPLLARVEDDEWFFDTELLYLAQRSRLSIHEVPVVWVDDPDSRVAIVHTALADLRGIRRLRRGEAASARAERAGARKPGPKRRRPALRSAIKVRRSHASGSPAPRRELSQH